MLRELSPKQKEIYNTLLSKTRTDKMDWKMGDSSLYFFEIKDYRIVVSLSGPSVAVATVIIKQGDLMLTSFTTPDTSLFYEAQSHCSERNVILQEIIRYLDDL